MSAERMGSISGIKKLLQKEEDIRGIKDLFTPGLWFVNGVRYATGNLQEAKMLAQQDQQIIEDFKTLNERINERARQKALNSIEPTQKDSVLIK